MASLLEEMGRENFSTTRSRSEIGADPELDEFMVHILLCGSRET